MHRPVVINRRLFVAQRIAGRNIFEFRRRDDFTRQGFLHSFLFLAFQSKHVTDFFSHLLAWARNSVRSGAILPDMTRMTESLPAKGSMIVLNT